MELMLKTHDSESDGLEHSLKDLREEWLPQEKLAKGLIATDMDGTMFGNDLGIVLFVEQMLEPHKWKLSRTQFRRVLLPFEYWEMIEDATHEKKPQLPVEQCRLLLMLRSDLEQLYALQRRLLAEKDDGILPLYHPVVREFMRKMIEFDRLIMTMESYFSSRVDGKFLMRLRFMSGMKAAKKLPRLIRRFLKRRQNDPERFAQLEIPQEKEEDYFPGRRVKAEELPPLIVDRYTPIIEPTRELLKQCLNGGAHVAVVSANMNRIVEKAITNSRYKFLNVDEGRNLTIAGTTYHISGRGNHRVFTHHQAAAPYFGGRKAIVADERAKARKRILIAACGDSFQGDSAMGLRALVRGGIFVAVGKDYETTRRTFHPLYEDAKHEGVKHTGQKIWYIETNKPESLQDAKGPV